jgi:hypothetical protein
MDEILLIAETHSDKSIDAWETKLRRVYILSVQNLHCVAFSSRRKLIRTRYMRRDDFTLEVKVLRSGKHADQRPTVCDPRYRHGEERTGTLEAWNLCSFRRDSRIRLIRLIFNCQSLKAITRCQTDYAQD